MPELAPVTREIPLIRNENQLDKTTAAKLPWLKSQVSSGWLGYKAQLVTPSLVVTSSNYVKSYTQPPELNLAAGIFTGKNKVKQISKAQIPNPTKNTFVNEVGASSNGFIYAITTEYDDDTGPDYQLYGFNNKGEALFSVNLDNNETGARAGDSFVEYQSILVDERGKIYLTGYYDGIDTNVFIQKRDGLTGQTEWNTVPFKEQNFDAPNTYWSIRTGEHPSVLATDGRVYVAASGFFPNTSPPPTVTSEATYLGVIDPVTGALIEQTWVNSDPGYIVELSELDGRVYLTTPRFEGTKESFEVLGLKSAQSSYSSLSPVAPGKKRSRSSLASAGSALLAEKEFIRSDLPIQQHLTAFPRNDTTYL